MHQFFEQLSSRVASMENREKGNLSDICDNVPRHICAYDFMTNDEGEYAVFDILEDCNNFYFGNSLITEKLKEIDKAIKADIITIGDLMEQGVVFRRATSAKGRTYTTIDFVKE